MLPDRHRFELLARETNRNFAHAVIYGGLSRNEAAEFCKWLRFEGVVGGDPVENLALYLDSMGDD